MRGRVTALIMNWKRKIKGCYKISFYNTPFILGYFIHYDSLCPISWRWLFNQPIRNIILFSIKIYPHLRYWQFT